MNYTRYALGSLFKAVLACMVLSLVLTACGSVEAPPPEEWKATIGSDGGTLTGPDGVSLEIPAGAVADATRFQIVRGSAGAPPLPEGYSAAVVYEITPHGYTFAKPVKINLPLPSGDPAKAEVLVANPGEGWRSQFANQANRSLEVDRLSLSWYAPAICVEVLSTTEPYPCARTYIKRPQVTATPASALANGPVQVLENATLHIPLSYGAAPDCTNPHLKVLKTHWDFVPSASYRRQLVWDQPAPFSTLAGIGGSAEGAALFEPEITFADNGGVMFEFEFTCTRAGKGEYLGYGDLEFAPQIAAPPALPVISQAPADINLIEGQAAKFTVVATGSNLTYQWFKRPNPNQPFTAIMGATINSAGVSAATLADDATQFKVQVCSPPKLCVDSAVATLSVQAAPSKPVITLQPNDVTVSVGGDATFTVNAKGTTPLTYQWQRNGTDISGATAASYTLKNAQLADNGALFSVAVGNALGSVTSRSATAMVTSGQSSVKIAAQPVDATVMVGDTARFSVGLSGTGPMTYQWQKNGVDIPGATNSIYEFNNAQLSDLGTIFSVKINDHGGYWDANSRNARLTVVQGPLAPACTGPNGTGWCSVYSGFYEVVLVDVSFGSSLVGIALNQWQGDNSAMYRTLDGGENWSGSEPLTGTILRYDHLAFADASTLVVTGVEAETFNFFALRSTDAGLTWTQVLSAPSAREDRSVAYVSFADANLGWIAADTRIFRTTDGGATWNAVTPSVVDPVSGKHYSIANITALGGNLVLAQGYLDGVFGEGVLLKSTDGGLNWSPLSNLTGVTAGMDKMSFANALVGVASLNNTYLVRTVDGGATWNLMFTSSVIAETYTAVEITPSGTGVALTDRGHIARTTDFGVTWQWIKSGTTAPLFAVISLEQDKFIAVGSGSNILRNVQAGKGPAGP